MDHREQFGLLRYYVLCMPTDQHDVIVGKILPISSQIPADHIHPLPDESHQMRCGGNEQIFKGTISDIKRLVATQFS